MYKDQFEHEANYRIALDIVMALFRQGLIRKTELAPLIDRLYNRFNPPWGGLPDCLA